MNRIITSRLSCLSLLLLAPMVVVGCTNCEECWDGCFAFCTGPCGDDPIGGDCNVQGGMFTVLCLAFVCQQNVCHSMCCQEFPDVPTLCPNLSGSQTEFLQACEEYHEVEECTEVFDFVAQSIDTDAEK